MKLIICQSGRTTLLAERELETRFGIFTEILYYDGLSESVAVAMGAVEVVLSRGCVVIENGEHLRAGDGQFLPCG